VHLEDYPKAQPDLIDQKLENNMAKAREIVTLALAERAKKKIKVRQPLLKLEVQGEKLEEGITSLIKEEINVKEIVFNKELEVPIKLQTEITPQLKEEGIIRELIRHNKRIRKKMDLKPKDKVAKCSYDTPSDLIDNVLRKNKDLILKESGAETIEIGRRVKEDFDFEEEVSINGDKLKIAVKR